MTTPICQPDLSDRPHQVVVEITVPAPVDEVYRGWTERFDQWFAEQAAIVLTPVVNAPYFFETHHEGQRHPHYGRFLTVEPLRKLEFTWMNEAGTAGVETVVGVELTPEADGVRLVLTHAGFRDAKTASEHEQAWRELLAQRFVPLVTGVDWRAAAEKADQ